MLQEMAQSPLMLSIMTLAYRGLTMDNLQGLATVEARRQHIFNAYIKRMFQRRIKIQPYTPIKTCNWLAWLARQMLEQKQSVFLIENLRPYWLPYRECHRTHQIAQMVRELGIALIGGLSFGVASGLIVGLIGGPLLGLISGIVLALPFGLTLGVVSRFLGEYLPVKPIEIIGWSWQKAFRGLKRGLSKGLGSELGRAMILGLIAALIIAISANLTILVILILFIILVGAVIAGLGWGVLDALASEFQSEEITAKTDPYQGIRQWVINGLFVGLVAGVGGGLVAGVGGGLIAGMYFGLVRFNSTVLEEILVGSLSGALVGALTVGPILGLSVGGGYAVIVNFTLRIILAHTNRLPWRLVQFLDYCVERIFLQRVGSGYIFYHRSVQEYFATLTPTEIERLQFGAEYE
jgi:hypothetical protein